VLDAGDFTLAVCGFGRLAINAGRFLHLLDEPDRRLSTDLYAELPTGVHGALAAQLSFPQQVRQENVQRVPPVLPDAISLAEHGVHVDFDNGARDSPQYGAFCAPGAAIV
jgi:hypothetical protein